MTEEYFIWETLSSKSSLVSIGTHSLFVSVSGPPRRSRLLPLTVGAGHDAAATTTTTTTTTTWTDNPVVIIFPGAGESSSSWPRVQEKVSRFARAFVYDRTGLGKSDDCHADCKKRVAVNAAEELCKLLQETCISGPYVLVAHSYGAIIAREFLHLRPHQVAGMVLAEGSTERQPQYFRLPDPNITAVLGNLKFSEVTGLKSNAQLSRDEWRTRAIEIGKSAKTVQAEAAAYEDVCRQLGEKNQFSNTVLGDRPVSVIKCRSSRDYEKIFEAGLKAGNGTEEQRREFRYLLDRWETFSENLQREQMRLSSHARWVEVPDCGHNINILRPDVIVQEIQWVLGCKTNAGFQL
jgi:pimeloyl-ACP methyl ester carboxylesterase